MNDLKEDERDYLNVQDFEETERGEIQDFLPPRYWVHCLKKWEVLICNGAFTHALICPFTFSWQWIARLDKTKLPHGRHIEIYRKCKKAVYCDTEYEIEEAAWELCNIGSFSIVCILNDNFNSLINYN